MMETGTEVGDLLREWRQRRRLSQLALAVEAEISQRHLSFLESGRASPSREMVLRLAEYLDVPLRERNALLFAAGFAPVYRERPLDDPDLEAARRTVELILSGQEPNPALAVDRHWNLLHANGPARALMVGVSADLLESPVNVLRLSLHPDGLAQRIVNYREWRSHCVERLEQLIKSTFDPALVDLVEELKGFPVPPGARPHPPATGGQLGGVAMPFELATEEGTLRFLTTTTVFGTALDVTLAEVTIESFFPADLETEKALRGG